MTYEAVAMLKCLDWGQNTKTDFFNSPPSPQNTCYLCNVDVEQELNICSGQLVLSIDDHLAQGWVLIMALIIPSVVESTEDLSHLVGHQI